MEQHHEDQYTQFRSQICEQFGFKNKCDQCSFLFATKKDLRLHESTCTLSQSLKCLYCDQVNRFSRCCRLLNNISQEEDEWQDLVVHVDLYHTEKYNDFRQRRNGHVVAKCDKCNWWFVQDFDDCTNCHAKYVRIPSAPPKSPKKPAKTDAELLEIKKGQFIKFSRSQLNNLSLESLRKDRERARKERLEKEQAEKKKKEDDLEEQRLADLVEIKKRIRMFTVQLDEKRSRILWNQKGFQNTGEIFERINWTW